jgi:hypothetical protein
MPKLRVHNLALSLDGYAAGPDQSIDHPLGVGGPRLHEWVFATRTGRRMFGLEGGEDGLDDRFVARGDEGIGATIMGRNMFGPGRGPWGDEKWTGCPRRRRAVLRPPRRRPGGLRMHRVRQLARRRPRPFRPGGAVGVSRRA